jgi:hypothetical protein
VALVQRIVRHLAAQPDGGARLPSGTLLTPRLLQTLGLSGVATQELALRCAVLCCAVLCCAVLCCAVLCCAALWRERQEIGWRVH